jgi:hypothetical protein
VRANWIAPGAMPGSSAAASSDPVGDQGGDPADEGVLGHARQFLSLGKVVAAAGETFAGVGEQALATGDAVHAGGHGFIRKCVRRGRILGGELECCADGRRNSVSPVDPFPACLLDANLEAGERRLEGVGEVVSKIRRLSHSLPRAVPRGQL